MSRYEVRSTGPQGELEGVFTSEENARGYADELATIGVLAIAYDASVALVVDGESTTLAVFLLDNIEDAAVCEAVARLDRGQSITFGGGATGSMHVERVS